MGGGGGGGVEIACIFGEIVVGRFKCEKMG